MIWRVNEHGHNDTTNLECKTTTGYSHILQPLQICLTPCLRRDRSKTTGQPFGPALGRQKLAPDRPVSGASGKRNRLA